MVLLSPSGGTMASETSPICERLVSRGPAKSRYHQCQGNAQRVDTPKAMTSRIAQRPGAPSDNAGDRRGGRRLCCRHRDWGLPDGAARRDRRTAAALMVFIVGVLATRRAEATYELAARWQQEGDEELGMLGIAASSSMWGVSEPVDWRMAGEPGSHRRGLLGNGLPNLRGGAGAKPGQMVKRPGEPAMLNDFSKPPLDFIDLDDVQEGHLWIPVSINKFDHSTTDPLVKMCQVNYAKYSQAPWLLPMGGLLALNSGCAEVTRSTVQIVRLSVLERTLLNGPVEVAPPTGFIFHETRCGSTLVANMLASVETNVMWSESTGPWKLMHTCPKCPKEQIVPWLKVIIDAMTRSARHSQFYFKFQSSEDIDAVTSAFPDVPWIFIFREPVEVMMSRLGAQRIGMEGMEAEVAARVEKGMAPVAGKLAKSKGKGAKEATTAQQLAGLCRKAIAAYEEHPGTGMMVEYPRLPDAIWKTVLPYHFKAEVTAADNERMVNTSKMYSKVASFSKGDTPDSKFTEDAETKHDAASVAVTEAAQKFLYSEFYKLRSMQVVMAPQ